MEHSRIFFFSKVTSSKQSLPYQEQFPSHSNKLRTKWNIFIQEQYYSKKSMFKPKRNMFLNFRNNILSYRSKFIKERNILEYSRLIFHQKGIRFHIFRNKIRTSLCQNWKCSWLLKQYLSYKNQFRIGKEHIYWLK